jgi:hypothetical protein
MNTDRLWICRKINFQLKTLTTRRKVLGLLYNSKKLRLSLKLDPRCLDRVLHSISVFCNFQIHKRKKKNFGPSIKLDPDQYGSKTFKSY